MSIVSIDIYANIPIFIGTLIYKKTRIMAKNNGMRQLKITKSVTVRDENFDKYLSEM